MKPPEIVTLTPGKRVLFLTKDPELIRRQLRGELDLRMEDLTVDDLLDDINTDAMTPAWVCFDYRPEDIARNAYAGLIVDGERLFRARRAAATATSRSSSPAIARASAARARRRRSARSGQRHPHRHRRVVRAHPRPQQHQPGRADGRTTTCCARLQAGEGVPLERVLRAATTRSRSW